MSGDMFHTLGTTWDQSARRGWTTIASFSMQALALSLLLFISLVTIQGPPKLQWLDSSVFSPPPAPAPPSPPGARHPLRGSEISEGHVLLPPSIPGTIAPIDDRGVEAAPDVSGIGVPGGFGAGRSGIEHSFGEGNPVAPPPVPAVMPPLRVSHWAEGNLIYRVQPNYPILARQARIQGVVELRAIISKNGTIENLTVLRGHAMLVTAAVEAVRQWRYRPYLLNNEPIEVETDITVNFTLSGN
jgi:periplasmic protein TonB